MYIYYKEIKNILSDTYIIRLDNVERKIDSSNADNLSEFDKYIITNISVKDNFIVLTLKFMNLYENLNRWYEEYKSKYGEEPSFF